MSLVWNIVKILECALINITMTLTIITKISLTTLQMFVIKLSALFSGYTSLDDDFFVILRFFVKFETKVFWE